MYYRLNFYWKIYNSQIHAKTLIKLSLLEDIIVI